MNDKDQAAIDHIASVSQNPHAAMIVKQLITGWDLKSNITGTIIKNTTWVDGSEWQLIEPKPAKPAYRVYGGANGTNTVDRLPNGSLSHGIPDGAEWLGEWIEYDPPKKWPTPLVERIAAIDIKAAEWIVDHWDDLLEDKYKNSNMYSRDANSVIDMFKWDESPQGTDYWDDIDNKTRK